MKVNVIGKQHLEGQNKKTGKAYNINIIHYTCTEFGVDGLAANQQVLDPAEYPIGAIQVGKSYNLEFNNRGYVAVFAPIG